MTRHFRLMITGLSAAAVLAAVVGNASARNISLSNQTFLATWASLEKSNTVTSNTLRCPVTLEGSFHSRTIAKILNSLVGYVTRANVNSTACTGGNMTILTETLPWHLRYAGFTGTLPTIATLRVNLIRAAFQISSGGNICLCVTTVEEPAAWIIAIKGSREAATMTADSTRNIALRNAPGGFFCGLGSGRLSGTTNRLSVLNSNTTRITVTLI